MSTQDNDDSTRSPAEGAPTTAQRSRRRRNVIGSSSHREEYVRLMEAGWSSIAIERYAAFRYGEDIPASTVRSYKKRQKIDVKVDRFGQPMDSETAVDVLMERSLLIELQRDRIKIDVQHERQMGKLFGSTRGEVALLNGLLDSVKADMQDLGLMPKAGESLEVRTTSAAETPEAGTKARTLGEALGMDGGDERDLARVLHMNLKGAKEAREA